jgi:UDP-glucose 4-epimerase
MNILISGDCGFVGQHLVSKLTLKHNLRGMDIKHSSWEDIRNYGDCLVNMEKQDVVIHLAAFTDVQQSITSTPLYSVNNIEGTLNLLNAAKNMGVKRFIFASSAAADNPQSPYGVTKLCGEHWCDVFQKCYGLSTVSLRFFNVYGKGTDKGVIPIWIDKIRKSERPIIYGGNQIRDFVYVDDVVRAIICAMECDATGTYEVGTGCGIAIFDLAFVLLEAMKSKLKIIPEEAKAGEIQESIATDTERTLDYLGFKAKYTLKQGLKEMLC